MTIDEFKGEYEFLSNFYGCIIEWEGLYYPTAEHAYQASKTLDPEQREMIRRAETPAMAKKLGRGVTVRPNWDVIKNLVMFQILTQKFENKELMLKLLQTGDAELMEGNWWHDLCWGCCKVNGVYQGENRLGKTLMYLREQLRTFGYHIDSQGNLCCRAVLH